MSGYTMRNSIDKYTDIYAKLIYLHNTKTAKFLKEFNRGSVKISNQNIIKNLKDAEDGNFKNKYDKMQFIDEYIITNKFIYDLLPEEQRNMFISLYHNATDSNVEIAANLIFSCIEAKKKQVIEKLNE